MKVVFKELDDIKSNIQIMNFSYLSNKYNIYVFKKNRRIYRNLIIQQIFDNKNINIDNNLMKIKTEDKEYFFSSSYSEYNIAVGIWENKIGLDIESYNKISFDKLEIFSSKNEFTIINSLYNSFSPIEVLTLIWSCKESLGKLYNIGLSKGFKAFEFYKNDQFFIKTNFENKINKVYIYYKFLKDICIVLSSFTPIFSIKMRGAK